MSITSLVRSVINGTAAVLAGALPYIRLTKTGATASGRIAQYQDGTVYLTSNLSTADAATWYLDDVSQNGGFVILNRNFLQFYTATFGANPRAMTQILNIDGNGNFSAPNQPRAHAYNSVNQSINSASLTALNFDTETADTAAIHSTSVNTSRFTCPVGSAGKWLAIGQVAFAPNATGARELYVTVNGTTKDYTRVVSPSGTYNTMVRVVTELILADGDYVEFKVFQDTGGALNAVTSGDIQTFGKLTKIG